jgi:hypothetical protein
MPEEMQAAVEQLLSTLDTQGQPTLPSRTALHLAIERCSAPLHPRAAYFRRAKWGLGCAAAVLPDWERRHPSGAACRQLLLHAQAALRGAEPLSVLNDAHEALFADLLDAGNADPALQVASLAGLASYAAARWVVFDFDIQTLALPAPELDPAEWEPALFASMACAGGLPWAGAGDAAGRRRFWTWCTRELLAQVWNPQVSAEEAVCLGAAGSGTGLQPVSR